MNPSIAVSEILLCTFLLVTINWHITYDKLVLGRVRLTWRRSVEQSLAALPT